MATRDTHHRSLPPDVSPTSNHRKSSRSSEHRRSSSTHSQQLQRPSTSDRPAVTVFMIENVHRRHLDVKPSLRTQSSSPGMVRARKKKDNVTFNLADNVNESDKQREIPLQVPNISLSHSKAMASIQRSMNKYRFAGH